jgi:hypothetical protein
MKKHVLFLAAILANSFHSVAQIPNNGFENWTNFGNYNDPTFWGSTNYASTTTFYAVTKSTDHFPANTGSYSVRLENNTSLNPGYAARGYMATGTPPPGPDFAIAGTPTSVTGYYKFAPQNGDTMLIQIQLYSNGNSVAFGEFSSTVTASNWTPFTIPISAYTTADHASMFIGAYYANGFNAMPHGNSVLYVDNLNFDQLITSNLEHSRSENTFRVFPNPASESITVKYENGSAPKSTLTIYNELGAVVKTVVLTNTLQQIDVSELPNGVYVMEMLSSNELLKQKLMVNR